MLICAYGDQFLVYNQRNALCKGAEKSLNPAALLSILNSHFSEGFTDQAIL